MSSLLVVLALLPQARAFAPTDEVWTGIEPHRVQHVHPQVQGELLRSEAWRHFTSTDGVDWSARFDEATGTPRSMWGRGIPMPTGSSDALVQALEALLARHADLIGFERGALALRGASYNQRLDTWYVEWDALRDGLPTYRGGLSARVKHGNLIALRVATAPDAPVTGDLVLSSTDAIGVALSEGPAPGAKHTDLRARPLLLERLDPVHGLHLRTTWQVRSRTQDPPGIWVSFVDAQTGELLDVYNEVRFAAGTVEAQHHLRTVDGSPLVTSPLPNVEVQGDVDTDITDTLGSYLVSDSGQYVTDLHGTYIDIDNGAGSDAVLASSTESILWTSADATQAEIDSYVFLEQVRLWGREVAPDVPMSTTMLESNVNLGSTCNAYYDGSVNFYEAGNGCNNTGQIADVNYHEWGHGFHAWSLEAGWFDGSLSEGAADTVSFLLTGDPIIAPYFATNGAGIRDVAPDKVYPDDYIPSPYSVHSNGLIFGGAMWDLWDILVATEGLEVGTASTEAIFTGLLKPGPDIAASYDEAMVADDDDGDLSNGTPHMCEIAEAFGLHGLGPAGDGSLFIPSHLPESPRLADEPIPIDVEVITAEEGCFDLATAEATLHYRLDGGEWLDAPVDVLDVVLESEIPAQPLGTFVEYYLTGSDSEGAAFAAPLTGEIAPYGFYVGDVLEVRCDDFESDDGGWSHKLLSGEDTAGADDWMWGTPTGSSGDPVFAHSGTQVWGNDLGGTIDGQSFNGAYQADKHNQLRSEKIDTAHYTGVFLHYWRWLNVEDGFYDQARITADGEEVWTNWASDESGGDHTEDMQWMAHAVDLKGAGDDGELRIAFQLESDGGLEFGGWTIDDVCVYAPATPDNRLGITDFVVEPEGDWGGPLTLSWTNPVHEPVERVVVIRRPDAFPEGHLDGEVVLDESDVAPGEVLETTYENDGGTGGYYAVYASDGVDFLSWTVEGWNASFADGDAGPMLNDGLDEGGTEGGKPLLAEGQGCGCATGGTSGAIWLLALPLLWRRRRP